MSAVPPRAILLIVLGLLFGPGYYAYCVFLSGKTAQTHVLTERAERWTLPDGSIQRTRSGLAFKPLVLALDPEMNEVQLRFTFHAGEAPAGTSGTNEYGVSLTFLDTPLVERNLRIDLRAGQAATASLPPLEITAPGDYAFLLQEIGQPAVPVTRVVLEVRRGIEPLNPLVVSIGVALIGGGLGWIALSQLARRR
jgi:hypothetical protein